MGFMNVLNLLAASENFIDFGVEGLSSVSLNWIGNIISWIFDLFSNVYAGVALGVILFTLCLKTLVLPLDIYSRVKMKKQSLLMKKMRPQMEKLQKQYANDKQMYQQKVMELQKKNGYNPVGACLPTLISLIIFMIVFTAFSTYSNYATLTTYNNLVEAYNGSVSEYVMTGENDGENKHFLIDENGSYRVEFDRFSDYYSTVNNEFDADKFGKMTEADKFEVVAEFVKLNARESSAKYYEDNKYKTTFLWIGNLWYPDSMLNREIPAFKDFRSAISRAVGSGMSSTYEESYNEVTFNLDRQKNTFNGYFVLIVLSIGFMFLQQFIVMRSQKDANELSTVDGSAASTNKWMMIIMPLIFGIVAFAYSAAFSIYMITNTVYSLISTLIINKAVQVKFDKREAEEVNNKGKRPVNRKRLK